MTELRAFQIFHKIRTVGAQQVGVRVEIKELLDSHRDLWTGETGPAVRFKMTDEQHGVSFHVLPLVLFTAAWAA